MIRAALLMAAMLAASAIDAGPWVVAVDHPEGWYEASASHHGRHGAAGLVIGAATYAGSVLVTDSRPARIGSAVLAGAAAGLGYEIFEGRGGASYVDVVDAGWVAAGALAGAALADVTGQSLTIAPRRDGAALAIAWKW